MKQEEVVTFAVVHPSLLAFGPHAGDWLPLVLQRAPPATDAVIAGAVVDWPLGEVQMTFPAADADAVTADAALIHHTKHKPQRVVDMLYTGEGCRGEWAGVKGGAEGGGKGTCMLCLLC